ncbi:MAG: alpha-hydroxy-acid oxidizing protein [Pseudomonadota bacterium]|nr:alpha-hydroxy-acid oxidizing protein [Pseudomonadota bacterium]
MWGVSVLGKKGPEHVISLLSNELQLALTQIGCPSVNMLNDTWLS